MDNIHERKEAVSFRFEKSLNDKLARLAEATGRSKTFLAHKAIEAYCDTHSWQIDAIHEGLANANKGNMISLDQIKQKWDAIGAD